MKEKVIISIMICIIFSSCKIKNTLVDNTYSENYSKITRFLFTDENGNDGCGYFDENKNIIYKSTYYSYITEFKGDYAVGITDSNLYAVGLDIYGNELLKLSGSEVKAITGGYGYFRHYPDGYEPEIVDITGTKINIPLSGYCSEGIGLCSSYFIIDSKSKYEFYYDFNKKDYLRNSNGNIFKSDKCNLFNHGFAVVGKKNGKKIRYGLINRKTKFLIPYKYNYLETFFGKYCLASNEKNEYMILDLNGKKILNDTYSFIFAISENTIGLLLKEDSKSFCRLYNLDNNTTLDLNPNIRPFIFYNFDDYYTNSENYSYKGTFLFFDKQRKKYGLSSDSGQIELNADYEEISKTDNGFWCVKKK